jgi:hypothetical protein
MKLVKVPEHAKKGKGLAGHSKSDVDVGTRSASSKDDVSIAVHLSHTNERMLLSQPRRVLDEMALCI